MQFTWSQKPIDLELGGVVVGQLVSPI